MVGSCAGLLSIVAREVCGWLLGRDDPVRYSISVALGYIAGIVVSYLLNQRFTFRKDAAARDWSRFLPFVGVAMVGLLSTWLMSLALRYGLPLERLLGSFSATVAFAFATVLSSLITYPLNAVFVFGRKGKPTSAISTTIATS
jgi:putative flippase GtrA